MKTRLSFFNHTTLKSVFITLVIILSTFAITPVSADVVLKTIDFSAWSDADICASTTSNPETVNGVTFYSKVSSSQTKKFNISSGVLTWCNNNYDGGGYYLGFPITGINDGTITIKVWNGSSNTRFTYKVINEGTTFSTSAGSGTAVAAANPATVTVSSLGTAAYVYIGRQGSGYTQATKIEVTTPGTSCTATAPGAISKGTLSAGTITLTAAGSPATSNTWYWQTSATGTAKTESGATKTVSAAGTYYIRSYHSDDCWSEAKSITLTAEDFLTPCQTPSITAQPSSAAASYDKGDAATALSVTASVTDGGSLSYQWYSNTTATNSGGTPISGATNATYTPSTDAFGTLYYYCVVTNTLSGYSSASTTSDVSGAITVNSTCPGTEGGTIYSLEVKSVSLSGVTQNTEVALATTYATESGGVSYLGNKNSTAGKAQVSTTGSGTIYFNGGDAYVKLVLDCPIQTDDELTFTSGSGSNQLCFTTTDSRATTYTTSSNTYTFPAAFNGVSTIYIWRSSGSGTYMHDLTITRPTTCTPNQLAYAVTAINKLNTDADFINPLTNPLSLPVAYSSTVESVATVAADGTVSIVGVGSTVIKASYTGSAYCVGEVSYTLTVSLPPCQVPSITEQPSSVDAPYIKDEVATALSVTASISDGGALSYQWYSNTTATTLGGTLISGATSASYTPSTAAIGTTYYYCVVTNTLSGYSDASVTSAVSGAVVVSYNCPAVNSGATIYKFVVKSSMTSGNVCAAASTDYPMTTGTGPLETLEGGTLTANVSSTNRLQYASGAFTFKNGDGGVLRVDLECPIQDGDVVRFINGATNTGYNAYVRHTSSATTTEQISLAEKSISVTSISMPSSFIGKTTLYIVRGDNNNALISYFEIVRACAVILNANGGTIGGESSKTLRAVNGESIALPHAVKDGQLFQGWYDAPTGGNKVSEPYIVSGTATLYAQYETCPSGGTLYKFELGTGLTNGAVGVNNVDFEFTTDNYLSSIFGGTLMTGGGGVANVQIVNNNAINLNNNSAYLKIDLDCELRDGDYFKTTIGSQNLYVNKSTSRSTVNSLPTGTLVQTLVPSSLVGVKTIYLWKGGGTQALTYFEIVRPQQTDITFVAPNAYNHYTTSIVAVKESPMPVIATLPARSGYVFSGYYDQPDGGGTQYYDGLGNSVRNWDKDVETQTLYAKWVEPCNAEPTLKKVIPLATIWDGQDVDMALIHLACDFDTAGISYSFVSASEAIPGCTYSYFDERIYIQGTPAVGNSSTITKTITFTMTNNCVSAPTYTVEATIRIYPAGQKPKVAFILTGTEKNSIAEGGNFDAYTAQSSCTDLLTYLGNYYDITCVNGYATKDVNEIEAYYSQYDLLVVTDFLNTGKGYTNAIGTMIDKKPILSFEAYVSSQPNWHIGSNPEDPKPKVYDMKVLCAGHAIFKNAKYLPSSTSVTQVVRADTTVHVIETPSGAGDAKGLQGFVINEAPDFIFLATVRDANNNRDLIVCCERQVVFPARLLIYGINFYEMGGLSDAGKIIMWQMMDYLLMTDETKVADCSLIFDNHDGDNLWSNPKNWAPGYNIVPTPYHPTRIEAECHVDTPDAHAGSVKVNKGTNAFGHTVDGKLIIKPYGGLTIAGMVAKVNDTRYASPTVIKAEDLLIEADASNNGAFVYGNKESDVRATVQYYSRGCNATTNPVWQYIGIPFQVSKTALGMFRDAWMCKWITGATAGLGGLWQWVLNEELLIPFEGYCITQENSITYTNAGKLLPPITTTIALDNRDDDGYAFAANSWTAPIKIQEMAAEDFTNAEQAIYIYHTGSYNDWTAAGSGAAISAKTGHAVTTPGQYAVIPIQSSPYLAGADSVIPAMQGFFVKVDNIDDDARLDLVYNRVVYDSKYFRTSTQPMRAPARRGVQTTDDKPEVMQLFLYSHSTADRVYLLSRSDFSDDFENGWDGRKIEGDPIAPKLSVVKAGGEMAVAAIPTFEERYLSFRGRQDSSYTFTFDYDGEPIYLYDQVTQQATLIQTGNSYSFDVNNSSEVQRFLITKNPPLIPADIEVVASDDAFHIQNYAREQVDINIFDVQGRIVYRLQTRDEIIDLAPVLPVGVYMARIKAGDTVKVVKLIGKEGAL